MSLNQWNTEQIKLYKEKTGQALLSDEQTLVSFSQDFGKLINSSPAAVCAPQNIDALQSLITFARQQKLPITIRGNGLSQCGQSLSVSGGLLLSMQHFTKTLDVQDDSIWVEANASWASLLERSLPQQKAPFILPYNCNLSVGGVLSAGGVGASSFKYGAINAHVSALEVIDGSGVKQIVDQHDSLFHACLSGQGRFAVITKACIQLRAVKKQAVTYCLVYTDQQRWFKDIYQVQDKVDYIELFCSPSIQGAKLKGDKRTPMAQWLYGLHLTVEFDEQAPDMNSILDGLAPFNVINIQEESISSYLLRHNSRFDVMKMLGQWDLAHPWYECFIPTHVLKENLDDLLNSLPIHYASMVHVVPMAKQSAGFLMLPEDESICSFMILTPGVPAVLKDSCLQAIQALDKRLIALGGKRYLSGFLGYDLQDDYWAQHFGDKYDAWVDMKKEYDPAGIFKSVLYSN